MSDVEIKDFQEEVSFELFDEIYNLGKRAMFEFGEKELGNFLITTAFHYRSRLFELEHRKAALMRTVLLDEMLKEQKEQKEKETEESESDEDESFDRMSDSSLSKIFKKIKVH